MKFNLKTTQLFNISTDELILGITNMEKLLMRIRINYFRLILIYLKLI